MKVLALDPSFTAWGWAVLEVGSTGDVLVACGAIRTSKTQRKQTLRRSDDDLRRAQELYRELASVWHDHQPVGVVTEIPGGSKSARASKCLGIASGVLASLCEEMRADVEFYTPQEVKKEVTGNKSATKESVEMVVRAEFDNDKIPKKPANIRENVCDAIAVFLAARNGNLVRRIRRLKQQEVMA